MAGLKEARARAREERKRFHHESLRQELSDWISEKYHIDVVATDGERFLEGGRGEIVPDEGCLYYDQRLESKPEELLEVIAHEFGHFLLHKADLEKDPDKHAIFYRIPLGRINEDQLEKETNIFAANLLVPQKMLDKYKSLDTNTIAKIFGVSPEVIGISVK